jgi:predicted RNase H-like nuclease (RuvC/YqgF family)
LTKLIKLVNGDSICAGIVSETKAHILIDDPLKLETITMGEHKATMLSFWIPLGEMPVQVPILREHIVVMADVTEEVDSHYSQTLKRIKEPEEEENFDREDVKRLLDEYRDLLGKRTIH